MLHVIRLNETKAITIQAKEFYSSEKISVSAGEKYRFQCRATECWKDLLITSTPDGYNNLLANLFGKRLNGVKCFCLCGAYNDSDEGAFAIGSNNQVSMNKTGTLSFFANDTRGFYWNNSGSITIHITRIG